MVRNHRVVIAALMFAALFGAVEPIHAQPNCGGSTNYNSLTPYSQPGFLELIVRTSREIVACPASVQAEGWIQGWGGASTHNSAYTAEVHRWDNVGVNGTYYSSGKHWWIWYPGTPLQQWINLGSDTGGPATLTSGMCVPPLPDWVCTDGGGTVSANGCSCEYHTPIIADVAGDGYRLTDIAGGVMFDLDADGTTEAVSWTRMDSDDAFLALDRNGNGKIDNGSELFGNNTPAYNNEAVPPALNGFVALQFTEGPTYGRSQVDGRVDVRDDVFSRLVLWQDRNHNGVSEPDELRPATELGLLGVSTDYKESKRKDRHGNMFKLKGRSWWAVDGQAVVRPIFDVSLLSR